jgi:pilus assembly protein FimV
LQSNDWLAYRNKMAESVQKRSAVAGNESANAGRISPKIEEKTKLGNENQDVLKLSKGEAPGKAVQSGEQARIRALEEEVTARQKGLDESNQRVSVLQKNVHDMEKLLALKSRSGLDLQGASKTAIASAVTPQPKAEAIVRPTALPVASPPLAASMPHASEAMASKPKHRLIAPAAPIAEPSVLDIATDNALPIGGGLAALALGGLGLWWARRRKQGSSFADSVLTGGDLKSNTLLGNTGGAVISTQPTENSFLTDFSRQGLGTIDTDEVDPIAEAEVYMAYDRNEQAEEILRDALIKDPSRNEIRMKLLEIFAAKKDVTSYEEIAADLFTMTAGKGALWEKAAYQGGILDPENPLYKRLELPSVVASVDDAVMSAPDEFDLPVEEFDLVLDELPEAALASVGDFDALMSEEIAETSSNASQNSVADLDVSLDFDMDDAVIVAPTDEPLLEASPLLDVGGAPDHLATMTLDAPSPMGVIEPAPVDVIAMPDDVAFGMDFGLDDFLVPEDEQKAEEQVVEPVENNESMLLLDVPIDFSVDAVLDVPAHVDDVMALDFDDEENSLSAEGLPDLAPDLPDLDLSDLTAMDDPLEVSQPELSAQLEQPRLPELPELPELPDLSELVVENIGSAEDTFEAASAEDGLDLDFDFSLDAPPEASASKAPVEEVIDLGAMNLDFDAGAGLEQNDSLAFSGDDPVQTKIDLAKAYVDMGDAEGAREILQEAIGEGSPEQQQQANALLDNL